MAASGPAVVLESTGARRDGRARPGATLFSASDDAASAVGALGRYRNLLWHLLGGTRGGPTRIRILRLLRDRPSNTNQVAREIGVDYKTAEHHLRVLLENRIVVRAGDGYGTVFLLSPFMQDSLEDLEAIAAKVAPSLPVEGPVAERP